MLRVFRFLADFVNILSRLRWSKVCACEPAMLANAYVHTDGSAALFFPVHRIKFNQPPTFTLEFVSLDGFLRAVHNVARERPICDVIS